MTSSNQRGFSQHLGLRLSAPKRRILSKNSALGAGFSLPELLIVIILTGLFSGLILSFTFGYWRYGFLLQADLDTLNTRLNAGDFLREAIGSSSGLIIQNSISDNHPGVPDPSNLLHWAPIHAIPGNKTVGSPGVITSLVYFRHFSANASGQYIMNGSQPYEDEYILYLDGTTKSLIQRSLANPSANGNRLKTSCPSGFVTSSCPADKVVATDLSSVNMRYFSRTGNLLDYTSIWDSDTNSYAGPDFTAVEVVEFTINLSKKPTFQKTSATSNSTIIRIALRNS